MSQDESGKRKMKTIPINRLSKSSVILIENEPRVIYGP